MGDISPSPDHKTLWFFVYYTAAKCPTEKVTALSTYLIILHTFNLDSEFFFSCMAMLCHGYVLINIEFCIKWTKNKVFFSIKDFSSKCEQIKPQET